MPREREREVGGERWKEKRDRKIIVIKNEFSLIEARGLKASA